MLKPLNEIKVNKPGLPDFPIKINSDEEYYRIIKILDSKGYGWSMDGGDPYPFSKYNVIINSNLFSGYPIFFKEKEGRTINWYNRENDTII